MPSHPISSSDKMGIFAPNAPAVVEVILIGETLVAALLIIAVILGSKHRGYHHHYIMLSAFLLDELIFKPLMMIRATDGSNSYFPWDGTAILPHLILSIVMTLLGIIVIFLGYRHYAKKEKKMFMPPKGKIHKLIGAAFVTSWVASYIVGLWIFATTWL
jgi:uncharacterized membrane protein YozB (DUF420 family)